MVDAAVETLSGEDAQFNLGHVQPTPVRGRVVELEAIKVCLGVGRREEPREAGGIVRIEVIEHYPDAESGLQMSGTLREQV